jgi:predicted transglutaminase-like cysteine proteinase
MMFAMSTILVFIFSIVCYKLYPLIADRAPFGWLGYNDNVSVDADNHSGNSKIHELNDAFREVKKSFIYTSDEAQYQKREHWAIMTKRTDGHYYGDCEDFALTCRSILLKKGWSKSNLRLALCWDENGAYHCVCVATVDDTDYIIDNRARHISKFKDSNYKWDRIQDADSSHWDKMT